MLALYEYMVLLVYRSGDAAACDNAKSYEVVTSFKINIRHSVEYLSSSFHRSVEMKRLLVIINNERTFK